VQGLFCTPVNNYPFPSTLLDRFHVASICCLLLLAKRLGSSRSPGRDALIWLRIAGQPQPANLSPAPDHPSQRYQAPKRSAWLWGVGGASAGQIARAGEGSPPSVHHRYVDTDRDPHSPPGRPSGAPARLSGVPRSAGCCGLPFSPSGFPPDVGRLKSPGEAPIRTGICNVLPP